ncbi:MAG: hypothetical protein QY332_10470 [Anaerolineales bacterium]|jgi:ABC-type uncharacterized transport system permease subunit|nr:MAG: hypothetical protein QY332_10470 [Anaerolineales bacterium]
MSKRYLLSTALAILVITISALFFDAGGLISYGLIIASVWGAIAILAVWLMNKTALRKILRGQRGGQPLR